MHIIGAVGGKQMQLEPEISLSSRRSANYREKELLIQTRLELRNKPCTPRDWGWQRGNFTVVYDAVFSARTILVVCTTTVSFCPETMSVSLAKNCN